MVSNFLIWKFLISFYHITSHHYFIYWFLCLSLSPSASLSTINPIVLYQSHHMMFSSTVLYCILSLILFFSILFYSILAETAIVPLVRHCFKDPNGPEANALVAEIQVRYTICYDPMRYDMIWSDTLFLPLSLSPPLSYSLSLSYSLTLILSLSLSLLHTHMLIF